MEGFVGEQKVFVVDPVLNREPVSLDENGGDVVGGSGNDQGGRVLDDLKSIEQFGGNAREDSVAVVDPGCDKCMDQDFCAGIRLGWAESGDVAEVEESSPSDVFYVGCRGEGAV